MIDVRSHPAGAVLPVRAQPGARRSALRCAHNGRLKVSVTAAAEKGKANQAIAQLLCEKLSLAQADVELLSGAGARDKQFLIRGLDARELARRVTASLTQGDSKSA
jgi:uncharacterized protein (TIGR00251 family)